MKYSDIKNFEQLNLAISRSEARSVREQEKLEAGVVDFRRNFSPFRFVFDLLRRSAVDFSIVDAALWIFRGVRKYISWKRSK